MKPRPLKRYGTPRYPTKLMIMREPDLLLKSVSAFKIPKGKTVGALLVCLSTSGFMSGCFPFSSTGCVVVLPPSYLTEEEALQIITEEFADRGVTLSQDAADLEVMDLPFDEDAVSLEHDLAVEFISREDCDELIDNEAEYDYCDFYMAKDILESKARRETPNINFLAVRDPEYHDSDVARDMLKGQLQTLLDYLAGQGVI